MSCRPEPSTGKASNPGSERPAPSPDAGGPAADFVIPSRPMPLTSGVTIGPYKVEREIGRGGMGVVFLAQDVRLHRTVALKALPDDVAADPDRLQRFEREARVLASLNHPNIAAIYGLEESGGRRYLALELIEGETLSDRIARGSLPLHEALDILIQN